MYEERQRGVDLVDELLYQVLGAVVCLAVDAWILDARKIVLDTSFDQTFQFLKSLTLRLVIGVTICLAFSTLPARFQLILDPPDGFVIVVCVIINLFPLLIAQVNIQLLGRLHPVRIIRLGPYTLPQLLSSTSPRDQPLVSPDVEPRCQVRKAQGQDPAKDNEQQWPFQN